MAMLEGLGGFRFGAAGPQPRDRAYFLDLLGDGHHGLGRYDAAIEAYRQAAQGFLTQDAPCSYALCLLKMAGSYLSLRQPWHALGYLEACLPLLRDLGLVRHEALARDQLEECRAAMALARSLGEGRAGRRGQARGRPARPAGRPSPASPGQGKFEVCPAHRDDRAG